MKVNAEEVVFGTFLTKAGSVVSVNVAAKEVTVKELGTGKPFVIKVTPDSTIKQIPETGLAPGVAGSDIAKLMPGGQVF